MVTHKMEVCRELIKLVIEMVVVVAEAVKLVLHQNETRRPRLSPANAIPLPYVGLLP